MCREFVKMIEEHLSNPCVKNEDLGHLDFIDDTAISTPGVCIGSNTTKQALFHQIGVVDRDRSHTLAVKYHQIVPDHTIHGPEKIKFLWNMNHAKDGVLCQQCSQKIYQYNTMIMEIKQGLKFCSQYCIERFFGLRPN